MIEAKYLHTNIVARDWRRVAKFYTDVFGCEQVGPIRSLSGKEVEAGTGVAGAVLSGVQLRLPGHGLDGPTLEIFQYPAFTEATHPESNRPGLAHLAFEVTDVPGAEEEVFKAGGSRIGETVTFLAPTGRTVTWCYLRDPEDNVLELIAFKS